MYITFRIAKIILISVKFQGLPFNAFLACELWAYFLWLDQEVGLREVVAIQSVGDIALLLVKGESVIEVAIDPIEQVNGLEIRTDQNIAEGTLV